MDNITGGRGEGDLAPRAVLINGTVGVGKTTVADAVGTLLTQVQIPNAVIDVDCCAIPGHTLRMTASTQGWHSAT